MSSPVPLLRAPQPGGRSQSGSRTPKLSLGITPSPSQRPVTGDGHPAAEVPKFSLAAKGGPPKLSLATPMGGYGNVQQETGSSLRPHIQPLSISTDASRSRSDSFHNSVPGSASSSTYSKLSLDLGGFGQKSGTPDPSSAISSVYSEAGIGGTGMEREGSMGGLSIDFDKLCLERGRPLDVEDLDDDGWAAASEQKKIEELGSLGEGAGGAVTRCKLQDASTVFALKVYASLSPSIHWCLISPRSSLHLQIQTLRDRSSVS